MEKLNLYLDMDGTIADLYAVENWLDRLTVQADVSVFKEAEPIYKGAHAVALEKALTFFGAAYNIIVLTKLPPLTLQKMVEVEQIKKEWLQKHINYTFDDIICIPYDFSKEKYRFNEEDSLIDDEEKNLKEWNGNPITIEEFNEIVKFFAR